MKTPPTHLSLLAAVALAAFAAGPAQAAMMHRWSFNDGTANDSAGTANGTLYGTATISAGRLQLSGSSAVNRMEATLGAPLGVNKTLVAWFTLSSLTPDNTAGGPLGVWNGAMSGLQSFDSICYGERVAGQWMNGSDGWYRTPTDNGGVPETLVEPDEIMMAITYDASAANKIKLYRNGVLYAEHNQGALVSHLANGKVLMGPRFAHDCCGPLGFMDGYINEARIYDTALTADQIAALSLAITLEFVQEPQNLMAQAGEAHSLVGRAIGDEPIGYQWYKNDAPLGGATSTNLDFPALQAANAGSYYLVAHNASMTITSRVARVVVRTPDDKGLLAQWTFDDGTARDVYGFMDGTLYGGATITDGRLILNGTDAFTRTVPLASPVTARTLAAWVAPANLDQSGGGVITLMAGDGNVFDSIVFGERQPQKWISGSDGFNRTQDVNGPQETAGPTELVHMAIVYGADSSIALYRNGHPYAPPYTPGSTVRTYQAGNGVVQFGMRHALNPGGNQMFAGEIDEAMLFDRALTPAEVGTLAGLTLFVWQEPQNQFPFIGETATFTVGASGTAPMAYQWLKNGEPIAGKTATNLVLANVQLSDAAGYSLVVSDSSGSVTSTVATLTVYRPIQNNLVGHWKLDDLGGLVTTNATGNDLTGNLVEFPEDDSQWFFGRIEGALGFNGIRRVVINDSALFHLDSFSVAFWIQANNLGFDGTPISKESASHCETWGLELRGSGQLNFFMFNNAGFIADVQSSAFLDTGSFHHVVLAYNHLTSTPDIYLDGVLVSSTRGRGPASGPPGYDTSPLTFGRRLGACTYPQSFDGLLDDVQLYNKNLNSSQVSFLFNNPGGVLNPNVDLPPAITAQPQSQTVLVGSNATFSVTAEGTTPLRYQWFHGAAALAQATGTNLTLSAVRVADAGDYTVVVSNYLGSVTSVVATLRAIEFGSGLLAKWTFDDGTANDVIGLMNGTLQGGAFIQDGRLLLNGSDAYVQTDALPEDVREKTLMAWVGLASLDQSGGGVITLQRGDGNEFDSIVYGERTPRQWMSGSEFFNRSVEDNGGPPETALPHVLVHVAIVYKADNTISLYRNGQPYATPYVASSTVTYSASGGAHVMLGMRHGLAPGGNRMLTGEIDEASLYNRALTPAEIAASFAAKDLRFVVEPQSTTGVVGEARILAGMAIASTPIGYQWYKNGLAVAGATGTNLALTLKVTDAAGYQLVASSAGVSVTSRVAQVVVRDPANGSLVHRWSFNDGTAKDSVGLANGTLYGTATIIAGRLQLSGSSPVNRMEGTLGEPLGVNKTLVAWFTLSSLTPDNTAGGPLGVWNGAMSGLQSFDSICYGERTPGQWMNGSDGWYRTPTDNGGAPETLVEPDEIMMAITYDELAANKFKLYRNGVLYAEHNQGALVSHLADGKALIGPRFAHSCCGPLGFMDGYINEARIYGSALTASDVALAYSLGPDEPGLLPVLSFSLGGTSLTLSWPVSFSGFILESASSLPAPEWKEVTGVVNNSVTVSTTAGPTKFYRLRAP